MSLLTTLVTGAGVNTSITGQATLESHYVIGDIDTANPLQGIKVVAAGETTIDIQGSVPLVSVFMKLMQTWAGTVIGLVLKIAAGRVNASGSSIIFTNGGATTPNIFSYSMQDGGLSRMIRSFTGSINALSNQTFSSFKYLNVISSTVASFDVTWRDGTTQNMTALEMDAVFASENVTEANGRLDSTVTTIDNRDGKYRSVKINATTATTFCVINF